jgi:G3E family GTPase
VDSELLRAGEVELLASVAGGCACCSGEDGFVEALTEIAATASRSGTSAVIVEASGLADPLQLLDVLSGPQLLPTFRAAVIVSVVDAHAFGHHDAELASLLERQWIFSDVVLLSKTDVALDGGSAARQTLKQARPDVEILECRRGEYDVEAVWRLLETGHKRIDVPPMERAEHSHDHTVVCPVPHPLERGALEGILNHLPPQVWRAKGFLRLRGEAGLFLLQYNGGERARWQLARITLAAGQEEPLPALVFIGSNLNREILQHSLAGALLAAGY